MFMLWSAVQVTSTEVRVLSKIGPWNAFEAVGNQETV